MNFEELKQKEQELIAMRDEINTEIKLVSEQLVAAGREQIAAIVRSTGLSVEALGLAKIGVTSKTGKAKGAVLPDKYRDPVSGKGWSGRGRRPKWMEGDAEQYAIASA